MPPRKRREHGKQEKQEQKPREQKKTTRSVQRSPLPRKWKLSETDVNTVNIASNFINIVLSYPSMKEKAKHLDVPGPFEHKTRSSVPDCLQYETFRRHCSRVLFVINPRTHVVYGYLTQAIEHEKTPEDEKTKLRTHLAELNLHAENVEKVIKNLEPYQKPMHAEIFEKYRENKGLENFFDANYAHNHNRGGFFMHKRTRNFPKGGEELFAVLQQLEANIETRRSLANADSLQWHDVILDAFHESNPAARLFTSKYNEMHPGGTGDYLRGVIDAAVGRLAPLSSSSSVDANVCQNDRLADFWIIGNNDISTIVRLLKAKIKDVRDVYALSDENRENQVAQILSSVPLISSASASSSRSLQEQQGRNHEVVSFLLEHWNDVFVPFFSKYLVQKKAQRVLATAHASQADPPASSLSVFDIVQSMFLEYVRFDGSDVMRNKIHLELESWGKSLGIQPSGDSTTSPWALPFDGDVDVDTDQPLNISSEWDAYLKSMPEDSNISVPAMIKNILLSMDKLQDSGNGLGNARTDAKKQLRAFIYTRGIFPGSSKAQAQAQAPGAGLFEHLVASYFEGRIEMCVFWDVFLSKLDGKEDNEIDSDAAMQTAIKKVLDPLEAMKTDKMNAKYIVRSQAKINNAGVGVDVEVEVAEINKKKKDIFFEKWEKVLTANVEFRTRTEKWNNSIKGPERYIRHVQFEMQQVEFRAKMLKTVNEYRPVYAQNLCLALEKLYLTVSRVVSEFKEAQEKAVLNDISLKYEKVYKTMDSEMQGRIQTQRLDKTLEYRNDFAGKALGDTDTVNVGSVSFENEPIKPSM